MAIVYNKYAPALPNYGAVDTSFNNKKRVVDPNTGVAPPVTGDAASGGTPINYADLIKGNAAYRAAQDMYGDPSTGALGSMGVQNLSDLQNAFRNTVIRFGLMPDTSQFNQQGVGNYAQQFLGSDVANLAKQNQFSVAALEDRAHADTVREAQNKLGAAGLWDSGENPYLLGSTGGQGTAGGKVGFQFAQMRDQDVQNVLGQLGQAQSMFQQAENQRQQSWMAALQAAMDRIARTQPPPTSNTPVVTPEYTPPAPNTWQPYKQPNPIAATTLNPRSFVGPTGVYGPVPKPKPQPTYPYRAPATPRFMY